MLLVWPVRPATPVVAQRASMTENSWTKCDQCAFDPLARCKASFTIAADSSSILIPATIRRSTSDRSPGSGRSITEQGALRATCRATDPQIKGHRRVAIERPHDDHLRPDLRRRGGDDIGRLTGAKKELILADVRAHIAGRLANDRRHLFPPIAGRIAHMQKHRPKSEQPRDPQRIPHDCRRSRRQGNAGEEVGGFLHADCDLPTMGEIGNRELGIGNWKTLTRHPASASIHHSLFLIPYSLRDSHREHAQPSPRLLRDRAAWRRATWRDRRCRFA